MTVVDGRSVRHRTLYASVPSEYQQQNYSTALWLSNMRTPRLSLRFLFLKVGLAATALTLILSYLTHPSTVRLILGVTLGVITSCLPESLGSLFRFLAAVVGRPDQVTQPY